MIFLRRFSSCAVVVAALIVATGVVRPTAQSAVPAQAPAQTQAPTASAILNSAKATALAEQKTILVDFGASWCGWCRRFDAFIDSSEVGPLVSEYFVLVKFVVQESPDKRALNTIGAQDLMNEWGGARAGLPFYVFLDAKGEPLATSNAMPTGANVGYPATPIEIQAFAKLLEQTTPRMPSDARDRIAEYLKTHAVK